jgi:hypothetical protein
MKISLCAGEKLLQQTHLVARSQNKTLNAAFREWLLQYAAQAGSLREVDSLQR